MTIVHIIETGVVAGVIMGAIDLIWLTTVAKKFYYDNLGELLRPKAEPLAAVIFYVMYIVGLCYFAVVPGLDAGSAGRALLNGALFGLFAYATYDLTNLSTLKGWSRKVTVVDMLWGTFLSGAVSAMTYLIMRHFV